MKPKFLFKNNGSLKEFGTGKDKNHISIGY